ncbi:MAG: single-stranded-DNA-specific exonuclease RecJ [Rickettsiales bacterium]|nr:MAG: single-stranded-DNA-specific exonuclease RecJ [Rickettsiales bacterium]
MSYFLNKKSAKGYLWKLNKVDEGLTLLLQRKFNISNVLARILILKKVSIDKITNFLDPKMKTTFDEKTRENILNLRDMQKGVDIIEAAILNKETIVIYGDYDVDGITSTALLTNYFDALNVKTIPYIPNRLTDGYGFNIENFKEWKEQGIKTIISVDNGTNCHSQCEEIKKMGINIVITDHHICATTEPPVADAVINPNAQFDGVENNEFKIIAGVGVAFLFLYALHKKLRDTNFFRKNKIVEPKLSHFLNLVALGTICDVMPLTGINRAFVSQGLKIMQEGINIGLNSLVKSINIEDEINVYHLGFIIGPRLNATGRLGENKKAIDLLTTKDENEANEIAEKLNEYNKDRQEIEFIMLKEAIEIIENGNLNNNKMIFLINPKWNQSINLGIAGILASRLKDKFEKPVFVATPEKDNIYKASCRSIKNVDISSTIKHLLENNLILNGGGHSMAGGFTFEIEKLEDLKKGIEFGLNDSLTNALNNKEKEVDLELECKSITSNLIKELQKLAPFGIGNPNPKVLLKNVVILRIMFFGKNNDCLKLLVADKDGVRLMNALQVICFKTKKADEIFQCIKQSRKLNLLGEISFNKYQGKENIQFIMEDVLI